MRRFCLLSLGLLALVAAAVLGDPAPTAVPYKIDFDPVHDVSTVERDKQGREGLYVNVKFVISLDGNKVDRVGADYKLLIEENGRQVETVDVPRPAAAEDLSVMLAIDTSGSMKEHGRMPQAREAAETFLRKLPPGSDCGLILFDHEIRRQLAPIFPREPLLKEIRAMEPRGGTAYLDAASAGVHALANVAPGRERAVVLLTDGIDLNSTKSLEGVVADAQKHNVRIYTIGIGEPGKLDKVSTALVLDHSGSMKPPADDGDTTPKIEALHVAASRFVHSMSSAGRCSLIPFSSGVDQPHPFTNEKFQLSRQIKMLTPEGETALFDATYVAVATLEADGTSGKRAVVAMTDGIDNTSRRRVEEVIERAREAGIKLYLLGFGREGELDRATMERMATETGGKYYHARNKNSLLEIFESLAIALHDDGIDEYTLTQLAQKTGGQYYPAKKVEELKLILERVTRSIQRQGYEITYKSPLQQRGGTQRNVALRLVRREAGGSYVEVEKKTSRYQTGGLLVAEMEHFVYLGLLAVLGTLIALPAFFRKSPTG
jgi:VWFA-related protein